MSNLITGGIKDLAGKRVDAKYITNCVPKAWGFVDPARAEVLNTYGIASVTRVAGGRCRVTFAEAAPNLLYGVNVVADIRGAWGSGYLAYTRQDATFERTSSSVVVDIVAAGGSLSECSGLFIEIFY